MDQFKEIKADFFGRDASIVATDLLGKLIHHRVENLWLSSLIIETESYYINDKGSHASLGWTKKRDALFSAPGTIYMYYARGRDSLNFSAMGDGNAVLIKSGYPYYDSKNALELMQRLNPNRDGSMRSPKKLCSGQTLLCQAMDLKVTRYDGKKLPISEFKVTDSPIDTEKKIQTVRLGIPKGRDEHYWQRFLLKDYSQYCTSNPLTKRGQRNRYYREFSKLSEIDFSKTASTHP